MEGQEVLRRLNRLPTLNSKKAVMSKVDDGFNIKEGYLELDYFSSNNKVLLFVKPYLEPNTSKPTIRIKSSGKKLDEMVCEEVSILPFCNDPNYIKITKVNLDENQSKRLDDKLRVYLDILGYENYVMSTSDKLIKYSVKKLNKAYKLLNKDVPGLSFLPSLRTSQ
ncbi:hypothetical protein KY334_01370 [Candidatus Woesearchaeota archaeon]|nr:hypothetical protein [Candidatus Woesearchaeota archaeon]